MVSKRKSQKGFALVTAVALSAVVLIAGGVLVYQISGGTKDIAHDTRSRDAVRVAEEGLSKYVGLVYKKNNPTAQLAADAHAEFLIEKEADAKQISGFKSFSAVQGGGGSKDSGSKDGGSKDSGSKDGGAKVTICHVPPGNPANAQTLEVAAAGWNGHDGHAGDTLGACAPVVDPCAAGKDGGSKDGGSKDGGSKDGGSKDGGTSSGCTPPAVTTPSTSTAGYGVKVVSWRETKVTKGGALYDTADGAGQFELQTSVANPTVAGTAPGQDSNALKLRVTAYVPNKAAARSAKTFEAIIYRGYPATATPPAAAPTPTPTPAAKDSGSKDSGSKDSGSKDSGSKDGGSKDSGSKDS